MDGRFATGANITTSFTLGGNERVEHRSLRRGDGVAVGLRPESAKQIGQSSVC